MWTILFYFACLAKFGFYSQQFLFSVEPCPATESLWISLKVHKRQDWSRSWATGEGTDWLKEAHVHLLLEWAALLPASGVALKLVCHTFQWDCSYFVVLLIPGPSDTPVCTLISLAQTLIHIYNYADNMQACLLLTVPTCLCFGIGRNTFSISFVVVCPWTLALLSRYLLGERGVCASVGGGERFCGDPDLTLLPQSLSLQDLLEERFVNLINTHLGKWTF